MYWRAEFMGTRSNFTTIFSGCLWFHGLRLLSKLTNRPNSSFGKKLWKKRWDEKISLFHPDFYWPNSHALWHVQVLFEIAPFLLFLNLTLFSIKFTLMTRKKLCCECSNYFCSTCLPREQGSRTRTCSRCRRLWRSPMFHAFHPRCRVLHKSPPLRGDLMKLRVKDLQHFLSKRQINIKACVGKFLPPSPILFDLGSLVVLRSTSVVRFVPHLLTVVHQETLPPSQGATNRISKNCQGPFNHWQWNGNLLPFREGVKKKPLGLCPKLRVGGGPKS